MDNIILEMRDITKVFPGTVALDKMNFDLKHGEVHAIVGENGAGKSTLMKILSGVYEKTSGQIFIDGKEADIRGIADAQKAGISMIHQELANLPKLSVAENIYLGKIPKRNGVLLDFRKMFQAVDDLFERYGIDIDSHAPVGNLTVAEKQFVEILKAINLEKSRIVIMDEPTSSLSKQEISSLFSVIEQLKKDGISIIYISHRLDEIVDVADRVSVFRDGKNRGTLERGSIDQTKIVNLMIGREIWEEKTIREISNEVVLEVKNLNIKNKVYDFNMKLYRGEIYGIAGLMGSGKDELVKSLFGLWPTTSKEIYYHGEAVTIRNAKDAIKRSIVYLPEERKTQSLFLPLSVSKNIIPVWMAKNTKAVTAAQEAELAEEYVKELSVKTSSIEDSVRSLSGGNQQKVVLARLLAVKPDIMILNDPTRGVDVGSKNEIYRIIRQHVEQGSSIVLLSSEIPEIVLLADRVSVLSKGEQVGEFSGKDVTLRNILSCSVRANI